MTGAPENVWVLGEMPVSGGKVWELAGIFPTKQAALDAHASVAPREGWERFVGRCEFGVLVAVGVSSPFPDSDWVGLP